MEFSNSAAIRAAASERVRRTPNARRIASLHALVPAALSLVLTLLSYLLSRKIEDTGGLSGLGLRSVLETAQSALQIVSIVFALFWSYGYVRVTLRWTRGADVRDGDLLGGFRCWGAVLRASLLRALLYIGAVLLASQVSAIVYAMTPLSEQMYALVEQMMADTSFVPTEEALLACMTGYLPFLLASMALFLLPLFYRLRLMDHVLMDFPERGAFYALRTAMRLTRGNRRRLVRLDLSFWWYYLLTLAASAVYYGDVILSAAGVSIGVSGETALLGACVLGLAAEAGLQIWKKNPVATAYTVLYEQLLAQLPQPTVQM